MMLDWQDIIKRHGAFVVSTVRRIVGNDADAEDVTQEVFLEVFRTSPQRSVKSWPAFLRRVATYRALDLLRARHTAGTDDVATVPDTKSDPVDTAIGRELSQRLRRALTQLSPQEAEVFCLRYFDDQSYEEIATTLCVTPNAVGIALHKARKRLETLLRDESP
jgi:RNA polymerase sigma-70 factor, ECF subfamily